jgi:hypothetical protein
MKRNNKQLSSLPAAVEPVPLRMVYKNEEVIKETLHKGSEKETTAHKKPNKLFVKEPLPLFNDHKFKAKDHDPL